MRSPSKAANTSLRRAMLRTIIRQAGHYDPNEGLHLVLKELAYIFSEEAEEMREEYDERKCGSAGMLYLMDERLEAARLLEELSAKLKHAPLSISREATS